MIAQTRKDIMTNINNYAGALDKGLEGIQVCSTALSTINNSQLYFRGYLLEDLIENSCFSETSYLLLKAQLPSSQELKDWNQKIALQMNLDEEPALSHFPTQNIHPMAWLRTALSLLGLKKEQNLSSANLESASLSLIAQTPLLISFFHRKRNNLKIINPQNDKSISWNFLYCLRGAEPTEEEAEILDKCLILHADHGLNCSTFSARVTSSSLSDLYSAIVSAVGTLKGMLHGGANEKVMQMLNKISSQEEAVQFVDKALERKEKIMGFGHRVYKEQDPRAKILKAMSKKITKKKGKENLFLISEAMEQRVKNKKGLCANVDFYSASVYHCLDIPTDLFTPVFAMSRMPGWLAHIQEQYSKNRIYRPASLWKGENNKRWKPMESRT